MVVADLTSPRDRLLESARMVLSEHGIEGIGLRAVARHAGVSHGAPLRHFDGLSHMLSVLAAEGFELLSASMTRAVTVAGPTASAMERLRAAGRGYVAMALADPGVFAVMFRPDLLDADNRECNDAGLIAFAQLVAYVEDAQADGWHRSVDAGDLAVVTWAQIHGLCELWLHGPISSDPRGIDPFVDLALSMNYADPTTEPAQEPS